MQKNAAAAPTATRSIPRDTFETMIKKLSTEQDAFDFSAPLIKQRWITKDLIAEGSTTIAVAKGGTGKSLFATQMAVCIVSGIPFFGLPTKEGDVLYIDQDTKTPDIMRRLKQLNDALNNGRKPKHRLTLLSMQGLSLSDSSLIDRIKAYMECHRPAIIILDSLHQFVHGLDPNSTKDMVVLSKLNSIPATIFLIHHISEKDGSTPHDMMTALTWGQYAMGSSVINQLADSVLIFAQLQKQPLRVAVRPVAKRTESLLEPFTIEMSGGAYRMVGRYEQPLSKLASNILNVFAKTKRSMGVGEMVKALDRCGSEYQVRHEMNQLESAGRLVFERKSHNLCKFYPSEWGSSDYRPRKKKLKTTKTANLQSSSSEGSSFAVSAVFNDSKGGNA